MASRNFTELAKYFAEGTINYSTDTFYAILVTAVPAEGDLDTWAVRSDVTTEHAVSGNYTTGGFLCTATVEAAVDAVNDNIEITIVPQVGNGNAVFSSATITAVGAIIYRRVGADFSTPATDELVSFVDFLGTVTSTNGDYNVSFTTPIAINVNV